MNTKLPSGYTARPATLDDVDALVALFNEQSMAMIGVVTDESEEVRSYFQRPGYSLAEDTLMIADACGKPVGFADLSDTTEPHVHLYSFGVVHPEHCGRGLGGYLVDWIIARGCRGLVRAPEGARVTMVQMVPSQDAAGAKLLESRGFHYERSSYLMRITMDDAPAAPQLPAGITIRPIHMETEFEQAVRTIRTSFKDHFGFVEEPFEQSLERWRYFTSSDPHFDPKVWYLALDDGEIAGVCYCSPHTEEDPEMAWVNTLGVRREWRGRGIGYALLRTAFVEFYRRGFRKVGLGVDAESLTGATRLYRKAGMDVMREYLNFEYELRAGVELATRALAR